MEIREAGHQDLLPLLTLYTHLHDNAMPVVGPGLEALWAGIMADPNHHILVGALGDAPVSSCVVIIVPNLTHGQRPYALVENVVTRADCRGRGYAAQVLGAATALAARQGCYKIMLMSGAKEERTLNVYRRAGFRSGDKTAFIRWLD